MIKLNSDKGREIINNYITALNGDEESIKWANDKRKAEYDTYDDELKVYYVIYTRDKSYNCYEEITLDNDVIRFVDDVNNKIVLEYEDVTGIKVTEI